MVQRAHQAAGPGGSSKCRFACRLQSQVVNWKQQKKGLQEVLGIFQTLLLSAPAILEFLCERAVSYLLLTHQIDLNLEAKDATHVPGGCESFIIHIMSLSGESRAGIQAHPLALVQRICSDGSGFQCVQKDGVGVKSLEHGFRVYLVLKLSHQHQARERPSLSYQLTRCGAEGKRESSLKAVSSQISTMGFLLPSSCHFR